MNHDGITMALLHIAATPAPSTAPLNLPEMRRVARRAAWELWSGVPDDRADVIAAFVEVYGPKSVVQSVLRDAMAVRTSHDRRTGTDTTRSTRSTIRSTSTKENSTHV